MSARSLARKYANALYQVATMNGTLDAAGRDLASVVSSVEAHPDLDAALRSPLVPPSKKRAVIEAVLATAQDTNIEVQRLLLLLADRDRFGVLREIAAEFSALVMAAGRVVSGEIVTAVPVAADTKTRLAEALSHATGLQVVLTDRVDPSIVAGAVARIGGVVYDGSATRQIEIMKQKLGADA